MPTRSTTSPTIRLIVSITAQRNAAPPTELRVVAPGTGVHHVPATHAHADDDDDHQCDETSGYNGGDPPRVQQ